MKVNQTCELPAILNARSEDWVRYCALHIAVFTASKRKEGSSKGLNTKSRLILKVSPSRRALSSTEVNRIMTEEENLCDRTYRAHERQQSKPDKPETPSLPRHSKQNHKVRIMLQCQLQRFTITANDV